MNVIMNEEENEEEMKKGRRKLWQISKTKTKKNGLSSSKEK